MQLRDSVYSVAISFPKRLCRDNAPREFHPSKRVVKIDAARKMVSLDDNSEMAFDLFLGVPKHRVPSVVLDSELAENGWVTVNPRTLETKFPDVYAVGDGANTGTPKAGVFAEGAAKAVASALISKVRSGEPVKENDGVGTCYIEFGGGQIGKVEVDFFSGPKPIGTYHAPSVGRIKTNEIMQVLFSLLEGPDEPAFRAS